MIDINNFPNNRDEFVGAEPLMAFLHGRTSGVFSEADSPTVTAAQGKMAVKVSDGYGWIADANKNGCAWWIDTEAQTGTAAELAIAPANSVNPRTDRVIIEWTTTLYQEHPKLRILQGTASASAPPPALTNTGTVRQLSLAQVLVPAGTTSITPGLITDERLDSRVCGLVTFDTDIDTRTMQAQFESLINALRVKIDQITQGILPDGSVSSTYNVNIENDKWKSNAPGYGYVIMADVPGILETDNPIIDLDFTYMDWASVDDYQEAWSHVYRAVPYEGQIAFYSDEIPPFWLSVRILCIRK